MRARTEAFWWCAWYGPMMGLSAAACQDAIEAGRPGWAALFAAYTAALIPVYFTLHWRSLRD